MDFAKMKTNTSAEISGVWVDGPCDSRFLIGRYMNTAHRDWLAKNGAGVRAAAAAGIDVTAESEKLGRKAVAACVLLGWENVALDGKVLTYSPEAAEQLFVELPDLFRMIIEWATETARYRTAQTQGK